MKMSICRWLFQKVMGWSRRGEAPFPDKCVICVAPHTSNWDLVYGWLFYGMMGRRACFMMKKEWFFFPLGLLFRAMGAVPVNRSKHTSTVEQMVERFRASDYFNLAITPEATRQATPHWKTGFYYIALLAEVPIVLAALDYDAKAVWWGKIVVPSGNIEKDMAEIKASYRQQGSARHPQRFKLDER